MSAEIIPFPTPPSEPPANTALVFLTQISGADGSECSETVHYFTSKRKPCQCGKEVWPEK